MHPDPSAVAEKLISDYTTGAVRVVKTQNCDNILAAIKEAPDVFRKNTGPNGARYAGSVPLLVAGQWARECGAAVGTKEFLAYARKKLMSGEYNKLIVHGGV